MADYLSSIHSDARMAAQFLAVLEALTRGETLPVAFAEARVTTKDARAIITALRTHLSAAAGSNKTTPRKKKKPGKKGEVNSIIAYSDGGSRGNPGESACAVVLLDEDGVELLRRHQRIGKATNNVAEYGGVRLALELAAELGARRLLLNLDSELVVKQIKGEYRVKHPQLKPLYDEVMALIAGFDYFRVHHVRREDNELADKLVNAALDGKDEDSV